MYEKSVADVKYLDCDYESAAKMYLEGARDGDELASFNYGYCLLLGLGVEKNPTEAKSFFAFARDMEGGEACYNIAMQYLHGEGVPRDYGKAYQYMTYSAEGGCIEAQLYLGMAYTSGCMFEPDVLRISMIPCHTPIYRNPYMMLGGEVEDLERDEDLRYSAIKQDAKRAFEWFQAAARHDPTYVEELSAKGKYLYAKCFADGLGVDFDRERTARLMLLAGAAGSPEALEYIAEHGITYESVLADMNRKRLGGGK